MLGILLLTKLQESTDKAGTALTRSYGKIPKISTQIQKLFSVIMSYIKLK